MFKKKRPLVKRDPPTHYHQSDYSVWHIAPPHAIALGWSFPSSLTLLGHPSIVPRGAEFTDQYTYLVRELNFELDAHRDSPKVFSDQSSLSVGELFYFKINYHGVPRRLYCSDYIILTPDGEVRFVSSVDYDIIARALLHDRLERPNQYVLYL